MKNKKIKESMDKLVERTHSSIYSTTVDKCIIKEDKNIGVAVLREYIDFPCNARGDHVRSSLWLFEETQKPRMLYSDNAYSGERDPSIRLDEVLDDGILASIPSKDSSRYQVDSKRQVKITFDGQVKDSPDFKKRAEGLVKNIGCKLRYDWLRASYKVDDENIAVLIWEAENDITGKQQVYLVWEDQDGQTKHKILDSGWGYLSIDEVQSTEDSIEIRIRDHEYEISKKELFS